MTHSNALRYTELRKKLGTFNMHRIYHIINFIDLFIFGPYKNCLKLNFNIV